MKTVILKYVGDEEKLNEVLKKAQEKYNGEMQYFFESKYGDVKITLNLPDNDSNGTLRFIVSELKDSIYAEIDETLPVRLFDLLKLRKLRISVAESFTAGRLASSIINNSGASEIFSEGIVCYGNESKISRLNVNPIDIKNEGAVSSTVAYEMALGLLKTGNCDVAVATTGLAGPKSDESNKPVGLCYFAVGNREGIHTYKYFLKGDREEITETAKNIATFLAIKNIKNYK